MRQPLPSAPLRGRLEGGERRHATHPRPPRPHAAIQYESQVPAPSGVDLGGSEGRPARHTSIPSSFAPHAAFEEGARRPGIPAPAPPRRKPGGAVTPRARPVAPRTGLPGGSAPAPALARGQRCVCAAAPPQRLSIPRSRRRGRCPRGPPSAHLRRGWTVAFPAARSPSPEPLHPKQINTHLGWDAALREASSPDPAGRRRLRPPPLRAPAGRAGLAPYVSRGDRLRASRRPAPPPLPAAPLSPRPPGPRAPDHPAGAAGAQGPRPLCCSRLGTPSAVEGKEKYNLLIASCASSSGLGNFLMQQPFQIEYSQMRKGGLAYRHSFNKCLLSSHHVSDTVLGAWHIAVNQRGGVLPLWNIKCGGRFEPSPA